MKWVGIAIAIVFAFVLFIFAASELGGEVVALDTGEHRTRLWVVEDDGALWLRAGTPGAAWLGRIGEGGTVTVERGGAAASYRATPDRRPARRERIHALMREKYGWADALISLMRDGEGSVPVRLDAAQP